jgi:hypothetical protein
MLFIAKNHPTGPAELAVAIKLQWIDGRYANIDYNSYDRSRLKAIIVEEQQELCCYCMKKIATNAVTLEHIIPRTATTQEVLEQYFPHAETLRNNIILQSVFVTATEQRDMPPYPHQIAYHNLVGSCKGVIIESPERLQDYTVKFCNGYRQDKFIIPLFYDPDIANKVNYLKGGLVDCEVYEETIRVLNLNYKQLQNVRKIWYYLASEEIVDILACTTNKMREDLLTANLYALSAPSRTELITTFQLQAFWDVLLSYQWFHSYFKNNQK